ncbi:hypothetical protein [Pelagimonas varians]|uniref:FlgN protein n=1 Tax=Pelagimonas varians TaxID=696760 RepID=A0A238KU43_9RHOB|nr:hypothetical protein [Pelagimonas varians]PYG32602.1 hypothetical protein C8N36_103351 [Pelagimonas varians]SMX46111.1 hypothetical protein PEV8663_03195 [Pelagimonas varians]
MTSHDAHRQITTAIETLTGLRNDLGVLLCANDAKPLADTSENRQLRDLHKSVSRAVAAYHKG